MQFRPAVGPGHGRGAIGLVPQAGKGLIRFEEPPEHLGLGVGELQRVVVGDIRAVEDAVLPGDVEVASLLRIVGKVVQKLVPDGHVHPHHGEPAEPVSQAVQLRRHEQEVGEGNPQAGMALQNGLGLAEAFLLRGKVAVGVGSGGPPEIERVRHVHRDRHVEVNGLLPEGTEVVMVDGRRLPLLIPGGLALHHLDAVVALGDELLQQRRTVCTVAGGELLGVMRNHPEGVEAVRLLSLTVERLRFPAGQDVRPGIADHVENLVEVSSWLAVAVMNVRIDDLVDLPAYLFHGHSLVSPNA